MNLTDIRKEPPPSSLMALEKEELAYRLMEVSHVRGELYEQIEQLLAQQSQRSSIYVIAMLRTPIFASTNQQQFSEVFWRELAYLVGLRREAIKGKLVLFYQRWDSIVLSQREPELGSSFDVSAYQFRNGMGIGFPADFNEDMTANLKAFCEANNLDCVDIHAKR